MKDDGGPAFPRPVGEGPETYSNAQMGMSLLEYYAGEALKGAIASGFLKETFEVYSKQGNGQRESIAKAEQTTAVATFNMAEAMVAEAKKRKGD